MTVVEGGLLAKAGMNANGVGVATNALITTADVGAVGVPYHLTLRALLDAEHRPVRWRRCNDVPRSSSANYMIAKAGGQAVDVEARPGDYSRLTLPGASTGWFLRRRRVVVT